MTTGEPLYLILAGLVVFLHVVFILFAVLGGLLVFRWRKVAWVHLPVAVWSGFIEITGWICPLTPLEIHLRERGGGAGYEGDFIEQYVFPVLYPLTLDRWEQVLLGVFLLALNLVIYTVVFARRFRM